MPVLPGHQRNMSQGQHLITNREGQEEEDVERGRSVSPTPEIYPGPNAETERSRPQDNKAKGICSDPQVRSNIKVILGSIFLTVIGSTLLVVGVIEMLRPDEGMQGWVFLFAGFLCFVPGFYHVYYVVCIFCRRPGYSFDRLPTFNR